MILVTGRSADINSARSYTSYLYSGTRSGTTGAYSFTAVTLPAGVSATISRPTFTMVPGAIQRALISGMFNPPLIVPEDLSANIQGLPAPVTAPTLAAGVGNGPTGTYIGYFTFRHKIGALLVAESNPSPGSNTLVLANDPRVWTGIATTCDNPRATHIGLYLSVAGGDAKFACEFAIGISTTTEAIADGSLLETISVRRGVPPYTSYSETFHDRVYFGGNPTYPDRIYYSELNEPESVHTTNYITTQGGEAVTGLKASRDQLLVTCANCSFVVHGFTSDDIGMERVSPSIGCIAPYSMVNLDETIVFASTRGLYAFDGGFRALLEEDLEKYWRTDYDANRALYQDAFACVDRETQCYLLLIPKATGFRYVLNYRPMNHGEAYPYVGFDTRTRKDYTMGVIDGALYTGSNDGYIRQENVMTNDDDDADAALKPLTIQTRHENGGDSGGEENLGRRWTDLDLYFKSESVASTVTVYSGEESASDSTQPQYTVTLPVGLSTGFVPKNRTHIRPPSLVGSGVTLKQVWTRAKNIEWRGYGWTHSEGPETRQGT